MPTICSIGLASKRHDGRMIWTSPGSKGSFVASRGGGMQPGNRDSFGSTHTYQMLYEAI
jgi:hypothetical protein